MSVTQNDPRSGFEFVGSGDDDLIAHRQSVQDFDFGDAGGSEAHRPALGDASLNEVGESPAFLVQK